MTDTPELLRAHHLKTLKLPTFLREYDKLARQCAAEGLDHVRFLARLVELELIDRERRMIERRIKAAKFPAVKSLPSQACCACPAGQRISFDFKAIPALNKMQVLELARCEWIDRRENVIALGPSGTGKTHVALGLGLAVCQKGLSVGFITAAALVHELMEARDERRLLRLQKQMANCKLLIIDELGFVPLSKTGAEVLFELISQRYERGATLITSDEWTETFGSERLTGALLDRLTHHVNILEMNGDSYRLAQSRGRKGIAINWGQDRLALAGQSAQAPAALIEGLTCDQFLADRAFDANWLREALTSAGIEPVIPPKSNRRFPAEFDRHTYKWRHLVENFFGKLKEYRGIAMRSCKTDDSFKAFISLAAIVIQTR